jgi:hypothetical protein
MRRSLRTGGNKRAISDTLEKAHSMSMTDVKVSLGGRCLTDGAVSKSTTAAGTVFVGTLKDHSMWCVARNVDVSILRIVVIGDTTGPAGNTSVSRSLDTFRIGGRADRLTGKRLSIFRHIIMQKRRRRRDIALLQCFTVKT